VDRDPDTAWLGGSAGLLLKTTDQGENFFRVDPGFSYGIHDLSFSPDGQYGYAVGPDGMYADSNDFGVTWNTRMLGANLNPDLNSLTWAPMNDLVGWIAGNEGSIYYTADRGVTWDLQDSKTSFNLYGICAFDDQIAWAVGDNGTIVRTDNAGQDWNLQDSGIGLSLRYCFNDNNFGLTVGFGGTVLQTADSGNQWDKIDSGITNDLYSLSFKPDLGGKVLAVGDGIIIRSEDFGNTWTNVFDEADAAITLFLKRVLYLLDGNAFAVGRTDLGAGFDFGTVPDLLPPGEAASSDGLTVESDDDGVNWLQVQLKVQF